MMKQFLVVAAVWCIGLPMAISAFAGQAEDEAAIRKAVESYVAAFNRGDAKGLAALWLPTGVYVNPISGERVVGREAIEAQMTKVFAAGKSPRLKATTQSIQFVSPSVAVEQGTATLVIPNEAPEESEYSAVYVKHNDQWLLDRVSEESIVPVKTNYQNLKDLEWMIGDWSDKSNDVQIAMQAQWAKNESFIIRTFSVSIADRIDFSGMQIIGWDPIAKQVHSWVFDSDGGFGEGKWTKKGNTWTIQSTATMPDGQKGSSTSVMKYIDNNTFTFQTMNREAGGELLANVPESVIVRN